MMVRRLSTLLWQNSHLKGMGLLTGISELKWGVHIAGGSPKIAKCSKSSLPRESNETERES